MKIFILTIISLLTILTTNFGANAVKFSLDFEEQEGFWRSAKVVQVGIGSPPQNVSLILDPGSPDFWVMSNEVKQDKNKGFNAKKSSTYSNTGNPWIRSPFSNGLLNGVAMHEVNGTIGTEVFQFGDQIVKQPFGLANKVDSWAQSKMNEEFNADGIIGLSMNTFLKRTPTFWEVLGKNLDAEIFTISYDQKNNSKGVITFGGEDTKRCEGKFQYTNMMDYEFLRLFDYEKGNNFIQISSVATKKNTWKTSQQTFKMDGEIALQKNFVSTNTLKGEWDIVNAIGDELGATVMDFWGERYFVLNCETEGLPDITITLGTDNGYKAQITLKPKDYLIPTDRKGMCRFVMETSNVDNFEFWNAGIDFWNGWCLAYKGDTFVGIARARAN